MSKASHRPKRSKDTKPRKRRKEWQSSDVVFVKKNWDTMSTKDIAEHLGFEAGTIRTNAKSFGLKQKGFYHDIKYQISLQSKEQICGVYGIVDRANQKIYIGSSYNCVQRCVDHSRLIISKTHYNRQLNELDVDMINYYILQECHESRLLETEKTYIDKYSPFVLVNTWVNKDIAEVKPFLENCRNKDVFKNYVVSDIGCWLYQGYSRFDGYGKVASGINGETKTLISHRVMFYLHTGEYPPLLRHTCDNRQCMNPSHLIEGSYRDNSLDLSSKRLQEFKDAWIKHEGDRALVAQELGWTTEGVYTYGSSIRISKWLNKTDLKTTHPQYVKKPRPYQASTLPNPQGSRGPKRRDFTGQSIDCWKCVDNNVGYHLKKWVCNNCGRERICSKWCVKRSNGCSVCGAK